MKFANLKALTECRFDGNPLRSPPIHIAEEGVKSIERYLVERLRRETLLLKGLDELQFSIDTNSLYPRAAQFFQGGTEYLLIEDIDEYENIVLDVPEIILSYSRIVLGLFLNLQLCFIW